MRMKFYLIIAAVSILLSSCLKQSIADAMLNKPGTTATLSYEINGTPIAISVKNADQYPGSARLYCQKFVAYDFYDFDAGELVFTFPTDSLKVGNYRFARINGIRYVTDFGGYPQYVAGPTDYMDFNITSYKDGYIGGNFSGQLTPAVRQGPFGEVFGASGSVLIKNGKFNNVPVFY